MSGKEKMVGLYGFMLPPLTIRHVVSCGKSCGSKFAPQLTHLAQKLKTKIGHLSHDTTLDCNLKFN